MRIYLVRHGKTKWNILGKMQGCTDIPLSKVGEKQAELVKKRINDKIDVCFSSPLKRAIKTANIITDTNVIIDERLLERKMGNYEGKETRLYNGKKYWNYKLNYSDNGVEPVQDLFKRTSEFINDLKKNYKDQTILIVSHGATIRALHFCISNYKGNEDFLAFDVPNCAVFEYDL